MAGERRLLGQEGGERRRGPCPVWPGCRPPCLGTGLGVLTRMGQRSLYDLRRPPEALQAGEGDPDPGSSWPASWSCPVSYSD